jgi:formylglycine-generating enzyme required for sulfatase activity
MGGRLPTEAEWEYVARYGRNNDRYPWGSLDPSCDLANYNDNVQGEGCGQNSTAPVCSYSPLGDSALGICDLSGNVWEWVEDGYSPNYNSTPIDGSAAEGLGASKIIRGGGWRAASDTLTSTYRLEMSPSIRFDYIGVRLVRSVNADDPSDNNADE